MDVRAVYGGPFEDFVARRRELANSLRAAGDSASAKRALTLRKPTRSAWLVNRLVGHSASAIDDFLALGPDLARAHEDADGARLRELSRARTRVVDRLTAEAVALGRAEGYEATAAVRAEVAETLTAALADPELAEALRGGALAQPVRASGFGPAGWLAPLAPVIPLRPDDPPAEPAAPARSSDTGVGGADPGRAERLAALADALVRAEAEVVQAEAAAGTAADEAGAARAGARDAAEEAGETARLIEDLRARLAEAEQRLAAQRTGIERAEARAAEAAARHEAVRAEVERAQEGLHRVRAETARALGLSSGPRS